METAVDQTFCEVQQPLLLPVSRVLSASEVLVHEDQGRVKCYPTEIGTNDL